MKYLYLALKRAMRTVFVPIILVLCAVAAFFAPLMSEEEGLPPAGVYSADKSEAAERVVSYLSENKFVECEDEETLRKRIARGEYNCGVIIYEGFEEKIRDCETEGLVLYMTTPSSFIPMIYQNHIMTAIYKEYAPYFTASLIDDSHFADHEVVERYFEMTERGGTYTFEIKHDDNTVVSDNERAFAYTMGISAMLIFALIMYGVRSAVTVDLATMKNRIGVWSTLKYSVIPSLAVRAVCVVLAFSAGIILSSVYSGNTELIRVIGAVATYTVLITAFGTALSAICNNAKVIEIVTFFILVAGLMLCPIYYDLSAAVPWIATFRNILPVYWMWICDANLAIMLAVTAVTLPASFWLLYLTSKKTK